METKDIQISIIVPIFNESLNLYKFHQEIIQVLDNLGNVWEIIYVDDGSVDDTFKILQEIAHRNRFVRVIQFTRNFGQTAALSAALTVSKGEIIVPIDADLQNDPKDIPKLLSKLYEGYDVVSGWRRNRKDKFLSKKLPSMIANKLISLIGGLMLHDYGCSLKAYTRKSLEGVKLYGEMHRFLPLYAFWYGAKISEVEVNHRPRVAGRSKYNIMRTFNVILDLITVKFLGNYMSKPLYFFGKIGLLLCSMGILSGGVSLYDKYFRAVFIHKNPKILIAIFLFIIGFLLIMMGLLAELIIRMYYEIQGRQTFVIKSKINIET